MDSWYKHVWTDGIYFVFSRVHKKREKARDLNVRMPWETEISLKADGGDKFESISNKNKMVSYRGNYYGLLQSKLTSNGVPSNVTTIPLSDQVSLSLFILMNCFSGLSQVSFSYRSNIVVLVGGSSAISQT